MSSEEQAAASPAGAGSSTDQHATDHEETGTPITDKAPTTGTPAHGSSNAGINAVKGNREVPRSDT